MQISVHKQAPSDDFAKYMGSFIEVSSAPVATGAYVDIAAPSLAVQKVDNISIDFSPCFSAMGLGSSLGIKSLSGGAVFSTAASSGSLENDLNNARLVSLRADFSDHLKSLLLTEEFEYGIENEADRLVSKYLRLNELATKSWLASIFMENFKAGRAEIASGILRILARQDEITMGAEGEVIALAALTHKDPQIQEGGIRVFESWGSAKSLKILLQVKVDTPWLKEYLEKVISDLSETHAILRSKN